MHRTGGILANSRTEERAEGLWAPAVLVAACTRVGDLECLPYVQVDPDDSIHMTHCLYLLYESCMPSRNVIHSLVTLR